MDSSPFIEQPEGRTPKKQKRNTQNPLSPTVIASQHRQQASSVRQAARSTQQPSYDFLAGSPSQSPIPTQPASFAESIDAPETPGNFRKSVRRDGGVEDSVRAELNAVKYELANVKNEREFERVRHDEEIQKLMRTIETMTKEKEKVESEKRFLFERQEKATMDLEKSKKKEQHTRSELESKIRSLKHDNETLADALSDKTEELSTLERNITRERAQQEMKIKTTQQALDEIREDFDSKMRALEETQRRLSEKERENEELEKEVLRAKAQSGDLETLSIVKRELTEQVSYIKTMEAANRKLKEDLKALQEHRKNLDILEEEKAGLEQKVKHMEQLQNELAEAQTQIAIYNDQKKSWTAFLEGQNIEFQTPEDLARAFMKERIEHLALLEKQGRTAPEILEKDKEVERLEQEIKELKVRLEKYKEGTNSLQSSRQTIERNRRHALREVEFLRGQLKSYQSEEAMMVDQSKLDTKKDLQIQELESLLADYKKETQTLLDTIHELESKAASSPNVNKKRPREDEDSAESEEKIGQLTRKLRKLQGDIEALSTKNAQLSAELNAREAQLDSKSQTNIRILQLRDNPTANHERTKQETLNLLKAENAALLAQLEGTTPAPASLPRATVEVVRKEMATLQEKLQSSEKTAKRLRTVFAKKTFEFREAVHSIVGIVFDFLPNGRVRVSSENWSDNIDDGITFDGDEGTMKITNEEFRAKINPLVKTWVQERGDIPGLIATLVLDGCERRNMIMDQS